MSLVLAAALATLSAAPLLAQPAAPPADGAPGRAGWAAGRGPEGQERREEAMRRRHEERARALRAVLQLRPDQEQAFTAFQAAMTPHRPQGREGGWGKGPGRGGAAMTTPQRLDLGLERMQAHLEMARARAAAVKSFYAILSPEQQRAFDALGRMHGGEGGWRGHGRMGPGGPGPAPRTGAGF
jgi:hypothetical protein